MFFFFFPLRVRYASLKWILHFRMHGAATKINYVALNGDSQVCNHANVKRIPCVQRQLSSLFVLQEIFSDVVMWKLVHQTSWLLFFLMFLTLCDDQVFCLGMNDV